MNSKLEILHKGITNYPELVREYGIFDGTQRLVGLGYWRTFHEVSGRSIFDEDWDVCILLDACRTDELARFTEAYSWLSAIEEFPSLGSCTWQWMPRTFDTEKRDFSDVTYVCSNPFSGTFCDDSDFHTLDEVWEYAWDEEIGTVRPRPVTDRAIHHSRQTNVNRLVVHYLQPHVPFLVGDSVPLRKDGFAVGAQGHDSDWDLVAKGELERNKTIRWYRETLKKVLDEVDLLLSNMNAEKVVVTADHGEAFGEWGLYGHPGGVSLPCLTDVPWVETTATDEEEYQPPEYETEDQEIDRDEQLEALGYK